MEKHLKMLNLIVNIMLPPLIFGGIYNFINNSKNKMSTGTDDFIAGLFMGMAIMAIIVLIIKLIINIKNNNATKIKEVIE